MQFAVPTRNHRSSPFLASSVPRQLTRRRRPLYLLIGLVVFIFFAIHIWPSGTRAGADDDDRGGGSGPEGVVVTVLDRSKYSAEYVSRVIENRKEYANMHGYGTFLVDLQDYNIGSSPAGWARVPATRHAMSQFPHSTWFLYLDHNALIMNPSVSIHQHVTNPARLQTLMRRDVPIVPPDSIIRTYKHTPAEKVLFVLTQDHDGLNPGIFLIRRSAWARYFLDVWFDPIFRSYNFQRHEQMALEHIVQWHPTILQKLALVPQKVMNAYPTPPGMEGSYEEGDWIVHFQGCQAEGRSCEKELERYWEMSRASSERR